MLSAYSPSDPHEHDAKRRMMHFVNNNPDCFLRSNLSGHITGSCWLVSPDRHEVLLTHHKKIGAWLQLGGHADGEADPLVVALKEAQEESGITTISALSHAIFDIDIHEIGEHKGVAAHLHYDIRFALIASRKSYVISEESHDLAWIAIETLQNDSTVGESIQRMARKWLNSPWCPS